MDVDMVLNFGAFPMWDNMDDHLNGNSLMTAVDGSENYGNLLPSSMSMDFDEWAFLNPSLDHQLTTSLETTPISASPERSSFPMNAITNQTGNGTFVESIHDHNCPKEAYAVLSSLSFINLNKHVSTPLQPTSRSGSSTTPDQVPLDHVLRLNREACERLTRLLACSCARSPHLAMLYASIFSRVMIWYQQAVGCTQSASWNPTIIDTAIHSASSTSAGDSSPWSGTTVTTAKSACTSIPQATGVAVSPIQIAMGSFAIDDQFVQKALKKQLVLSEMRRAGRVIDLFIQQGCGGHCSADECSFGGVDSLYKSLGSWLRGEHARIMGIMKAKLSEMSESLHS